MTQPMITSFKLRGMISIIKVIMAGQSLWNCNQRMLADIWTIKKRNRILLLEGVKWNYSKLAQRSSKEQRVQILCRARIKVEMARYLSKFTIPQHFRSNLLIKRELAKRVLIVLIVESPNREEVGVWVPNQIMNQLKINLKQWNAFTKTVVRMSLKK